MYGPVPSSPRCYRRPRPPGLGRAGMVLGLALAVGGVGACQAALDLGRYDVPDPSGSAGSSGSQTNPPLLPGGSGGSSGGSSDAGTPAADPPTGDVGEGSMGCGSACELPHSRAGCADSGCIIEECFSPWRDANGLAADGCEAGDVPAEGLTLWFMADQGAVAPANGAVSAWIDQSQKGYTASQPVLERRPTWQARAGGLPMLSFDGIDDYFDLPAGFASFDGSSFFAVVEAEPNEYCAGILHFSNGADNDDVEFGRHTTNLLYYEVQGDFLNGTTEGFVEGRRLVVSSVQASSGHVELRIDGAFDQATVLPLALPANVERRINYVGRNSYTEQPDKCSMYFRGRIGELLFYPRGLSDGERARVEAYLHEKWQPE